MLRAAAILAILLATTTALAQQSIHPKNVPEEEFPLYKGKAPPDGWMSPDDRRILAISRGMIPEVKRVMSAPAPPPLLEPVVMNGGRGGLLEEHITRFWKLGQTGAPVEMRGACLSACTMITAFVPKERLCFAPGAYLSFHAARTVDTQQLSPFATWQMYASYPAEIRQWLDGYGGPAKMTIETFWTMGDRELWAIGYPKCK